MPFSRTPIFQIRQNLKSRSKKILEFEEELATALAEKTRRIVRTTNVVEPVEVVRRTDVEGREGVDLVGDQRIDFEAFAEVVVLHDGAHEEPAGELIADAGASDVTAEKLLAGLPVFQLGIDKARLNDQALRGPEGAERAEIEAIAQLRRIEEARDVATDR